MKKIVDSFINEKNHLNEIQATYSYKKVKENKYQEWKRKMYLDDFTKHVFGGEMLELGCAYGESTAIYAPLVKKLVCVEGSSNFIDIARKNVKESHVEFVNCLFEEITFQNEFDYVAANFILEHVADEQVVLRKCYEALKKDGLLFVSVPNATSFTRKLAVEMSFIDNEYALTESDINHGHRRLYDETSIIQVLIEAGFEIVEKGVSFIKPFAEFQMEAMAEAGILGIEQWEGLQKLAKKHPELAEAIFVIARKRGNFEG